MSVLVSACHVSDSTRALPVASSYRQRPPIRKSHSLMAASGDVLKSIGHPGAPATSSTSLMPFVELFSWPSSVCVGQRVRTSHSFATPSEQPEASKCGSSAGRADRLDIVVT